jgi:RsiW-degrading membrane proteinase PrsW (M82 family)
MFKDSNFHLFLLGVLPGLIYAFVVYLNSPIRTIRIKPATFYILFGMLSVFVVMGIQFIFPYWGSHVDINGLTSTPTTFSIIFQNFIQIGLTEEVAKAIVFFIATSYRHKVKVENDHPFAIMFYVCMISLGFALVENVHYIWSALSGKFIISAELVGIKRTFSAILGHMSFGLIMGYFFALTKKPLHGNSSDITVFNVWTKHKVKFRDTFFIILGVLLSSFVHGAYDLNLYLSNSEEFIIPIGGDFLVHLPSIKLVGLCFLMTYFMGKDLIKWGNESKKEVTKTPTN